MTGGVLSRHELADCISGSEVGFINFLEIEWDRNVDEMDSPRI